MCLHDRHALQCEAVAAFAGVEVEKPPFTMGITNKTPWFLKLNPNGKIPTLATPSGGIFESNAICRYLASIGSNSSLYPAASGAEVSI